MSERRQQEYLLAHPREARSQAKGVLPSVRDPRLSEVEEWRSANPPRTRLPESIWEAAVEMAQRHGLHCTTKALRMDYRPAVVSKGF